MLFKKKKSEIFLDLHFLNYTFFKFNQHFLSKPQSIPIVFVNTSCYFKFKVNC